MKTIKFRGQSIFTDHKWLYGSHLLVNGKHYIVPAKSEKWNMAEFEVIPETIGQFTGMFDKNGTEIFEGDIVFKKVLEGYDSDKTAEISFRDGVFGMLLIYFASSTPDIHQLNTRWRFSDGNASGWVSVTYEIMGNIHDNPELLKTK